MEFSIQEYWSGLPFPSPGNLSDPGIKSMSLMSPALAGRFFTSSATWEAPEKRRSSDYMFVVFTVLLNENQHASMFRNTTYSCRERDSKFKPMTVSWLWTMSELSCIMEEKIPATEVFLVFNQENKDMWHSNPFNWLVLKDMKVLQTPVSQPLHCRLQRCIRLQRWTVEADLAKLRVTWFGFGFGWDVGMGWIDAQRLRWGQMRLELEGSAGFTRAQQIRLLCYWSKARETSLKFIWGLRSPSSASRCKHFS